MDSLITTLLPLIIGSAVVPVQILLTMLLLRSSAGRITAVAWVAGLVVVRLGQGVVFGLILADPATASATSSGESPFVILILLVMSMLFFVTAARNALGHHDGDEPPPKWLTMTETLSPGRAFLMGAGVILISPKMWVFTLGAIAAIGTAALGEPTAAIAFLIFVAAAVSIHLAVLGVAYAVPDRAAGILDAFAEWLKRNQRVIMIVLGLVFGVWFLWKALQGLEIV